MQLHLLWDILLGSLLKYLFLLVVWHFTEKKQHYLQNSVSSLKLKLN